MKRFLISSATLLVGAALFSFSAPGKHKAPKATAADKDFFMKASSGGTFEIKSSQLALSRDSSNAAIASFARQMITDHTKLGDALKATAQARGVTVQDTLIGDDATNYSMLDAKSGADFEKSYLAMQVAGHKKSLALHKKEDHTTRDPQIKSTVESAIPVISHHLMMAQSLNRKASSM